jgi:hypothetical protein
MARSPNAASLAASATGSHCITLCGGPSRRRATPSIVAIPYAIDGPPVVSTQIASRRDPPRSSAA